MYDLDVKRMKKDGISGGRINYLYQHLLPKTLRAYGFTKIQRSVYESAEMLDPAFELPLAILGVCEQCFLFRKYAKDVRLVEINNMADISEVLGRDETPGFTEVMAFVCRAFGFIERMTSDLTDIADQARKVIMKRGAAV
jgi:virulence-associated protein VapD